MKLDLTQDSPVLKMPGRTPILGVIKGVLGSVNTGGLAFFFTGSMVDMKDPFCNRFQKPDRMEPRNQCELNPSLYTEISYIKI